MSDEQQAKSQIIKRSVLLAGHRTSVTLEAAFWDELHDLSVQEGLSINKLIMRIDAARTGNLASALRLYVLEAMKIHYNHFN